VGINLLSIIDVRVYCCNNWVCSDILLRRIDSTTHPDNTVATLLGLIAWILYTLPTSPPAKPIEEIEKEIQQGLETSEKKG
jgi:predicted DNA-binding transcriptional regulator